jgi:signal transduction histidine kinase
VNAGNAGKAGNAHDEQRLPPEELRTLFLFESLDTDKLSWLCEHGRVERYPAGLIHTEGEPATCFYVLLDGTISMSRRVQRDDVEITRTSQRGVYAGAMQAYLGDQVPQVYSSSLRALTECRMFVLPAEEFGRMMRDWFPMAMHLLEGLFFGMRNTNLVIGQRERLVELGALAAGLTHELNNPAAAAVRATSALRERVAGMRHKLALLAGGHIAPPKLRQLTELQEAAVERAAKAPDLSPLEASDREDELADWLDAHDIAGGYDLAPVFVAAGLDATWADEVAEAVAPEQLEGAMRWLGYTVETENLMREIEDSTGRISTLVGAAKQYSQMDRAPYQLIDVHDGLESTLVMLTHKIGDRVRVERDFDRSLPRVPAFAGELNQVWTNLVDNSVSAMDGEGTITVRTARDGDQVMVEIGDTGPGVPDELKERIFEPFFTTKPVGEGTGLGLDISWRIVVQRHRGDIRVKSRPGDTRFQVRLPITAPDGVAAG